MGGLCASKEGGPKLIFAPRCPAAYPVVGSWYAEK